MIGVVALGLLAVAGILSALGTQQPSLFVTAPPGPRGTWSGTVTYKTTSRNVESAPGAYSETTSSYEVTAQLHSTGGEGTWTMTGQATVVSSYSQISRSETNDGINPLCKMVVTDDASVTKTVDVEGYLDVSDLYYQFNIQIPEIQGLQTTTSDQTGCAGDKTTGTSEYFLGSNTVGSDGPPGDPHAISWSRVEPILNADGSKAGETSSSGSLIYNP